MSLTPIKPSSTTSVLAIANLASATENHKTFVDDGMLAMLISLSTGRCPNYIKDFFLNLYSLDQIWTFKLVYIYADWSFL
jgi:hypothetical protein